MTTDISTLSGVIPPVVTPLKEDRTFDEKSFERTLQRLLDNNVDGVFVLGSTGEVAFATDELRDTVLRTAVRVVNGRVPVLVGVVDTQTARVIEHIKRAEALGADAVVATAPFYARVTDEQIKRHFTLLGQASSLPVFAYDIPVCVHTKLDADMLVELGLQGSIAGVKDSSNDDVSFRRLALKNRAAGSPLRLFTGHEFVVDGAYLSGADGSVPGLGNVDPAGYVALHRAWQEGDVEGMRAIQDRLAQLMEICLVARSTGGWGAGVGAFKSALVHLGVIDSAQLPEPFEQFDERDAQAVAAIVDTFGPAAAGAAAGTEKGDGQKGDAATHA